MGCSDGVLRPPPHQCSRAEYRLLRGDFDRTYDPLRPPAAEHHPPPRHRCCRAAGAEPSRTVQHLGRIHHAGCWHKTLALRGGRACACWRGRRCWYRGQTLCRNGLNKSWSRASRASARQAASRPGTPCSTGTLPQRGWRAPPLTQHPRQSLCASAHPRVSTSLSNPRCARARS